MIYLAYKWGGGYTKSEVDTLLNGKSDTSHTHTKSQITDFPTIPSKTSDLTNDSGFLTSHQDLSGYVPKSGGAVISGTELCRSDNTNRLSLRGGTDTNGGASITVYGKDSSEVANKGVIFLGCYDGDNNSVMRIYPDGRLTWNNKNIALYDDVVPRTGGAVMAAKLFSRTVDNDSLVLEGATSSFKGAFIELYGSSRSDSYAGRADISTCSSDGTRKMMILKPDGTWTWSGTACQITSDKRLKQQITKIDNALLDAWQDVEPVQFKYNDAVNEKGDNARLHTGYVVQQINEACQKHDVNISDYGLYCHEEYPEKTEDVTITNEDGTTTKETKVIEEASEHYSLRYTETLVVECAYLRREVSKLKQQNENLEQRLKMLEQSVK